MDFSWIWLAYPLIILLFFICTHQDNGYEILYRQQYDRTQQLKSVIHKLQKEINLLKNPPLKVIIVRHDMKNVLKKQCGICFTNFSRYNTVNKLNCKHYFHVKCLEPWLHKNTCPMCRAEMFKFTQLS